MRPESVLRFLFAAAVQDEAARLSEKYATVAEYKAALCRRVQRWRVAGCVRKLACLYIERTPGTSVAEVAGNLAGGG